MNLLVLSGMFEQHIDKLDSIQGNLCVGLQDWFEYWENPAPHVSNFVLLTKRFNSVSTTSGSISVHVLSDMLSASAHKFNGPKGIGFLYIKNGTPIFPFNDGGAQESGRRAGTENIAAIVGMAAALKKSCTEIETYSSLMGKLESVLLTKLDEAGIDYCRNGGPAHAPGNISLSFNGVSGETLLHRLDLKHICVSTGSACTVILSKLPCIGGHRACN